MFIFIHNTVAVHVRHIREKIEINPRDPRYLKVVWGRIRARTRAGMRINERFFSVCLFLFIIPLSEAQILHGRLAYRLSFSIL